MPAAANWLLNNRITGNVIKNMLGIAPKRSFPPLHPITLRNWFRKNRPLSEPRHNIRSKVYFFCDEFTNYHDVIAGIKAIKLLWRLNYQVEIPEHTESGRAYFSKGLLKEAKQIAENNIRLLSHIVFDSTPLIGIEPSAVLGFRDEYPNIVEKPLRQTAYELASHVFTFEEFLMREKEKGHITPDLFTREKRHIQLHVHCHQKALSNADYSVHVMSIPINYHVEVIPSGCCGMAGSFGYEKEHYDISMQIGELVLFPAIRKSRPEVIIAAPGTSCRHQIFDGTGRRAYHPAEILYDALIDQ
jgi:Fe-S oxidoreductase